MPRLMRIFGPSGSTATRALFDLQNEITSWIANALRVGLVAAEAARPTNNPDALDYILRGRAAGLNPASRDSYAEMIGMFGCALALDPQSVEAEPIGDCTGDPRAQWDG